MSKRTFIATCCALALCVTMGGVSAHARPGEGGATSKVVDYDKDGYNTKRDCNDRDAAIHPNGVEVCGDGIDQNCDGTDEPCQVSCTDGDGDGYAVEGGTCGPVDCNDAQSSVFPGAAETCGDGIDQNCDGADEPCSGSGPHANLTYKDYPTNCLSCHSTEATEMFGSTHYQWTGEAPDMVNQPGTPQGKLTNAINSYCINIEGDWPVCGSCHAGRGKRPDDETAGLENIDCLACHNEEYAAARMRLPDGSLGVQNPTDAMVRNIQAPTRTNCLLCHARAGGGDGVKRGDISLKTITNSDPGFDVHMNTSGSDLACQQCHVFEAHRVIGKGSDLRATDDPARGSEIQCATCHEGKDTPTGHDSATIGRHVAHVACQTCHIPTYAKVATETQRDWRRHADGSPADGLSGPGHPYTVKASNLMPEYSFWNRLSDNYLLGDDASMTYDQARGTYPTSRPMGDNQDGKLYPFKYKAAIQPMTSGDHRLIALDTFDYMKGSGNVATAVEKGLVNMGYPATEPYEWVTTDTLQLLNHGVNPATDALQCTNCHENTARMDLPGKLGYGLKDTQQTVCTQCHGIKERKPFSTLHDKHVTDKQYDCSWCHAFSRPERGLRMP
ncbi:MAG: MopE-related protein [Desulfobulbaceae bacterium]